MDQKGIIYPMQPIHPTPDYSQPPPGYSTGFPQQGFQPQPGFQGYPQPPPQYDGNPTVITQQPTTVIIHTAPLGPVSQAMTCPSCRASIVTEVKYVPSMRTHFFAGLFCLMGCWCGCCAIPYCVDSCKDSSHSCPNCQAYLGSHNKATFY